MAPPPFKVVGIGYPGPLEARVRCSRPPQLVRPLSRRERCPSLASWLFDRYADGYLTREELAARVTALVRLMHGW